MKEFGAAHTVDIAEGKHIRQFHQIPDILTMDIPPLNWIVDGLIARKTVVLIAGSGGAAKSFVAQSLAVAVAVGGQFLGRICKRSPVLYLDYENPDCIVQDRFKKIAGAPIEDLKIWGMWNADKPPLIQSELLLTMAKEVKPLIIVDPFRLAHNAEENESTAMMTVMQMLKSCAEAGGAVAILHHTGKNEGSTSRGSSAIGHHVDFSFVQELSEDHKTITLRSTKMRNAAPLSITIKPDFESGKFEPCDSPYFTERAEEMLSLRRIIEASPGVSTRGIREQWSGNTKHMLELLRNGLETHWTTEAGSHNSVKYFPRFQKVGNTRGNTETHLESECSVSAFLSPLGRETQKRSLKGARFACKKCGLSFDTSAGRARHQVYDCKGPILGQEGNDGGTRK